MRSLFQNMQSDPQGTRAKIAEHRKETLTKVESKTDRRAEDDLQGNARRSVRDQV